ncbi:hypothetical protein PCE1_004758 [Barthelona sp. PCE]
MSKQVNNGGPPKKMQRTREKPNFKPSGKGFIFSTPTSDRKTKLGMQDVRDTLSIALDMFEVVNDVNIGEKDEENEDNYFADLEKELLDTNKKCDPERIFFVRKTKTDGLQLVQFANSFTDRFMDFVDFLFKKIHDRQLAFGRCVIRLYPFTQRIPMDMHAFLLLPWVKSAIKEQRHLSLQINNRSEEIDTLTLRDQIEDAHTDCYFHSQNYEHQVLINILYRDIYCFYGKEYVPGFNIRKLLQQ